MFFWNKNLPSQLYCQTRLQQLPAIAVPADQYNILETPPHFHRRMLDLIEHAQQRILMTLLYLQDDELGNEILDALYAAKQRNPKLYIRVYVDFHRAQRGLIGKGPSLGNSELYYHKAEGVDAPPAIYGVPVKRREIFGVMHLKGCVFDNTVLYSGASVNNVYLGYNNHYRLDRYHEIHSKELADAMSTYVTEAFHLNYAVQDFSQSKVKSAKEIRDEIKELRHHLTKVQYQFHGDKLHKQEVGITPIAGLGKRQNQLNRALLWLLGAPHDSLFICTPYFNPPKAVTQAIEDALSKGIHVTLVVGDKSANDFFIPPDEPFSTVGAVPYIYEQNLKTFLTRNDAYLKQGNLDLRLWQDGTNTYHVKGIFVDHNLAMITGNNLNPRAWGLDLENGLIIHDPNHLLQEKFMHEQQFILKHTQRIKSADEIQSFEEYPEQVKKLLNKVKRFKASIFIKQLL
ncbi:MAG: CDP-diacylglycerol--serine O-phosphatidyltransferase [Succinivibrio sp.]|nr:CDP-diacylglycerol--serine O-phosphatidyltransferase [Succinivibrio sp.]